MFDPWNLLTTLLRGFLVRQAGPFVLKHGGPGDLDLDVNRLGVYVHVPFCRSLCGFCPYSRDLYDPKMAGAYAAALLREIHVAAGPKPGRQIESVYFGGGTPALLINELPRIVAALRHGFTLKGKLAIELHPDDISEPLLQRLRDIGFDMVSVGIQSFSETCLAVLGRQPVDGGYKLSLVAQAGFSVLDVDLIFGLPRQTKADLAQDMRLAAQGGATQISTYPFIDFSFARNRQKPVNQTRKRDLLQTITQTSSALGLDRTAVWTFARPQSQRYSSVTRDNFLGFGPGAATLLRSVFKLNTFSIPEYVRVLNEGGSPTAVRLDFTPRARTAYWLFWSCYSLIISAQGFRDQFGQELCDCLRLELQAGVMLGLLARDGQDYHLTEKGAYYFHLVEQRYTRQYIDKTWHVLRETPWPEHIVLY